MTTPPRRWLWVAGELSAELTTGLLVYSAHLARAVAESGVDVTMVGLADPQRGGLVVDDATAVERIGGGVLRRVPVRGSMRSGAASVASLLPNLTFATSPKPMRDRVATLLAERWDAVVIDHLQAAWVLDAWEALPTPRPALVVITHNHEGSMRVAAAQDAPAPVWKRALLALDARKAARLERRTIQAADVVTAITDVDAAKFAADRPGLECLVLPPGWTGSVRASESAPPFADRPRRVGILGSFEWHVKQENLRRFVAAADEAFAAAGIELVVGGAVAPELRDEINATARATRLVGWVPDLDAFFDDIRIGVVSEPLGGGFKLKTLDYVFRGIPLAALTTSRAGVPVRAGESVIEASDEAALVDAIIEAIDDPARLGRLADAALAACRPAFRWSTRGTALSAAVGARSAPVARPV